MPGSAERVGRWAGWALGDQSPTPRSGAALDVRLGAHGMVIVS